jgi:hypothetical protein
MVAFGGGCLAVVAAGRLAQRCFWCHQGGPWEMPPVLVRGTWRNKRLRLIRRRGNDVYHDRDMAIFLMRPLL